MDNCCVFIKMLPVIVFTVCISSASSKFSANDWIHTDSDRVLDYRHNPILVPTDLLEWLLGDPTVVLFEQENELHMFVNEVFHGIIHYSANYSDPVNFEKHGPIIPDAGSVRSLTHLDCLNIFQRLFSGHTPTERGTRCTCTMSSTTLMTSSKSPPS